FQSRNRAILTAILLQWTLIGSMGLALIHTWHFQHYSQAPGSFRDISIGEVARNPNYAGDIALASPKISVPPSGISIQQRSGFQRACCAKTSAGSIGVDLASRSTSVTLFT